MGERYKTLDFWTTMASVILTAVYESGLVGDAGEVVAAILAALTVLGYGTGQHRLHSMRKSST